METSALCLVSALPSLPRKTWQKMTNDKWQMTNDK